MRQLPFRAQAYLAGCYLLGAAALAWLTLGAAGSLLLEDWLLGVGLALVSAACQVFVVKKSGNARSDHLTPAALFAALLLAPRPVLALVLLCTFLPEWVIWRRAWFIQVFNIASYLIACAAARLILFHMTGQDRLGADLALPSLYVLVTIPVFLGVQTILLAGALKLARGESFRTSGLFSLEKLGVEAALVCMGLGFALSWRLDPLYGIAAALPLALIFQALHVPNLKEEAATDPKTGLANMRHFNAVIARDIERAERNGQPLSVLMCDLDYLRNINNTYGHQAGDVVLVGIADVIRRHIRGSDVAARFGGEEFVVLLADTNLEGAREVAERLRSELDQARFSIRKGSVQIRATISIGVAAYPVDGRTPDALLHEADLAVYQAKRDGRNRVVVAGRTSRELASEWAREHLVSPPIALPPPRNEPIAPFSKFVKEVTRTTPDAEQRRPAVISHPVSAKGSAGKPRMPRSRRGPDPSPRLLALIGAILLAGLLSIVPGWPVGEVAWWPLVLFGSLTVLAEQLAVDISGRGKTSVGVVAVLGATFLYHELGILVTSLALALSVAIKARSRLHRILFNFGAVLLSGQGAHLLFEGLAGGAVDRLSLARMIAPAVAGGLVYYAINHLLLCLVRALSEQRNPWDVWRMEYRWLAPHYAVMGALGLVVALGQVALGWIGVVALMAPVGMMHLAIKQYMDRTNGYLGELRRMNDRLTDSYEATLQALTRALDTRDEETEEHSQRVRRYTQLLAERLHVSEDELEDMARGALLHDIGKIGVPDAILLKPGQLTDEERVLMRKHPEIGFSMIAHIPFLARAAQVVLHHHEAYDGSGYPSGLSGANIPLGARIFAVVDTFDAMTSDRPYRAALPLSAAFAEIERCRGTQFDPEVVGAFLSIPAPELLAIRSEFTSAGAETRPTIVEKLALAGA